MAKKQPANSSLKAGEAPQPEPLEAEPAKRLPDDEAKNGSAEARGAQDTAASEGNAAVGDWVGEARRSLETAEAKAAEVIDEARRAVMSIRDVVGGTADAVSQVIGEQHAERAHKVDEQLHDAVAPSEAEGQAARNPKWRRRKKARPDELIQAAIEVFTEQGFSSAKLKDVGKRAGVSKGTVYLYFKSKEDLLIAAVRNSVVPILDFTEDLEIESSGSASELLRELVHKWVAEFERRKVSGVPKLVMSEASNFPELAQVYVDSVVQRARRLFARVIKRGIQNGEFRDVDVMASVDVLMAPIAYLQLHRFSLGPFDTQVTDPDAFLETHIDYFLRAVTK